MTSPSDRSCCAIGLRRQGFPRKRSAGSPEEPGIGGVMLEAGDRLGVYEVVAHVGSGGMGDVYRARDSRVGRDVAIKVSSERFSQHVEREARAVATLNHPNICALYDVGPDYLVLEFVEGEAPVGPKRLDSALAIARQLVDAVE